MAEYVPDIASPSTVPTKRMSHSLGMGRSTVEPWAVPSIGTSLTHVGPLNRAVPVTRSPGCESVQVSPPLAEPNSGSASFRHVPSHVPLRSAVGWRLGLGDALGE